MRNVMKLAVGAITLIIFMGLWAGAYAENLNKRYRFAYLETSDGLSVRMGVDWGDPFNITNKKHRFTVMLYPNPETNSEVTELSGDMSILLFTISIDKGKYPLWGRIIGAPKGEEIVHGNVLHIEKQFDTMFHDDIGTANTSTINMFSVTMWIDLSNVTEGKHYFYTHVRVDGLYCRGIWNFTVVSGEHPISVSSGAGLWVLLGVIGVGAIVAVVVLAKRRH